MEELNGPIAGWLAGIGWSKGHIDLTTKLILLIGIVIVSWLAAKLFRNLLVPALQRISRSTKATWDDHLFSDRVMRAAARLIPPVVWYVLLAAVFYDLPLLLGVLRKVCLIYLIVTVLLLVNAFLDTLHEIATQHETLRNRPLKGIYQMVKLLAVCVGAILIVSILIGRDPTTILAGLGASAAIVMLIFRDSILGLVAGVQLSANDMLRPGDWITMEKYGADGYVTEVTLTTVKIQNFDKTITTIPPYALVSDSFRNWRGMRESGGRRIKRSLLIDIASVHASLKRNPEIHPDLMQMVRMLQPTAEGVPVEVYCFTRSTEWVTYEAVQDDLFDRLFAVLPEFGLRAFQRPSGQDLGTLRADLSAETEKMPGTDDRAAR